MLPLNDDVAERRRCQAKRLRALRIQEEISRVLKEAIDRLCTEVEERTEALESIYDKFGRVMDVPPVAEHNERRTRQYLFRLCAFYSADIDVEALCDETEERNKTRY